jgi:putative transcriptional regulator
MSKIGDDLILGMENALAHVRGTKRAARETVVRVSIPNAIDVAAIRGQLGLTQESFALRFGFSIKNVRNWEQGCRQPEGSARAYLTVIARNPRAVETALKQPQRVPAMVHAMAGD